nr:ABC transporter ATP-binding protein [Ardenticatena sp.]
MSTPIIRLEAVSRTYRAGARAVHALRNVSLTVQEGEFVAIVGPSGSGKSTLLGLIAGLDRPDSGDVWVSNTPVHALSQDALARWRRTHVGIVFQFFQLLPTLTALENVIVPLSLARHPNTEERAWALLDAVGVAHRAHHLPAELSGGEQQRVAIARALANDPAILLADEPTGNLDTRTGAHILALLARLHAEGRTLVLVTHDDTLAQQAERIVRVHDGRIVHEQ